MTSTRAAVWGLLVLPVLLLWDGSGLDLVPQCRGAHFASHTLWSAWICWMLACLSDRWFAAKGAAA